jgi:hypothetical protein
MNTVRAAQVRVMPPATEAAGFEVILLADEVAA